MLSYFEGDNNQSSGTETPDFPLAADMHRYLVSYAKHFGLLRHAQLGIWVHRAEWNEENAKWEVETSIGEGPKTVRAFDKVVYALGPDQIPNFPKVKGIENFQGEAIHSIAFKRYAHLLREEINAEILGPRSGWASGCWWLDLETPQLTLPVCLRKPPRRCTSLTEVAQSSYVQTFSQVQGANS